MSKYNGNGENHEPLPEGTGGNGGALFGREQQTAGGIRNLRSDARLAARLLSHGCIPVAKVQHLLQMGANLAGRSARTNDARGYAACMGVLIKAVGLEQAELGIKQPTQVNVAVGVQIVQREDFYANDAHDRIAEASTASGNGHAVAGEVQGSSVRKTMGQNGNGHDGGNGRPRPEAG